MSRLSQAIDANRRNITVGKRDEDREERTTQVRSPLLTGGVPQVSPSGQSRLSQAIDSARRGDTVRPQSWQDNESGFNSWVEELNTLSRQMGSDYSRRDGVYQDAAALGEYRDNAYSTISKMQDSAKSYRDFFEGSRDVYGDEAVDSVLSVLDQGGSYLNDLHGGLGLEYDFWAQFEDEDDYNNYQKGKEYAALSDAADFEELSRYVSTYQPGTEKFNAWSGTYSNSGFEDINYDYINRNKKAQERQALADISSNAAFLGLDNSERGEMTDGEIATFNYLYASKGSDAAYEYIDWLTSELNYRQRMQNEAAWAEYARESPVGSSVFSVLESPLKGLSYLGQFADYTADGEIDQNEGYNKFSHINSAIRNQVSKTIEESGKWGGVGSFAYQTGMSMGDFLFNTAIAGGNSSLTLGIMGTGAAADTTISAKDRGLSDDQAFALGTIAGAAEIITEKVSLDALLDKTKLGKDAMGYFLTNVLAEGSEEVGSDLINLVADILIAKDKSEWNVSIDTYLSEGMSESEAFWHAVLDQAQTMGLDFLGGGLSGGVMAGGALGINAAANYLGNRQSGQYQEMADGAGITTEQSVEQETPSPVDLLGEAAQQATETGAVTNRMAERILGNQGAVSSLIEAAGLAIEEGMTRAQQRAAVKSAVESLASRDSAAIAPPAGVDTRQESSHQAEAQRPSVASERPAAQMAYDSLRVQRAADALGESGAKALSATYDGSVDAESYYGGFASYYEAGVSGMDMGKVRSRYSDRLTEAQKFAAWSAGQNDAAASLAREQRAAQYAHVAGTDSGLVFDDYVADTLDADTAERVNSVAKLLGLRVRFADSVRSGTANAQISGSEVLVERNNPNPVMFLLGHEWTHRLQELAPTEYRAFREAVAEEVQDEAHYLLERYRRAGENISYENALDEAAANYAGHMIEDSAMLDRFIEKHKDNRTMLEKVRDAIRTLVSKLTGAERRAAQTAEGKLTAALEAAAGQAGKLEANKNAAPEGGEQRFSIKRTSQMTLAAQLKMFYDGKMASSDAFYFGETPDTLAAAGLDPLPLAFTVSDFRKSATEKHNVPRRVWKNLRTSLENALFAFRLGDRIGIMTSDIDGDGKPLLVGIERNAIMDRKPVNAIRSVYGLDNPGPWLKNQLNSGKKFIPLDKKRADAFLQTYGAYLASVGDGIRSMDDSVTQDGGDVKERFSLKEYSEQEKKDHDKAALEHFGSTYNWKETGYITLDGKRIDFSGRHDGAPGGYRTVDHRDIREALGEDYGGDDYSGAMVQFMGEGNIRISPETNGINLSVAPTKAQERVLDDFISKSRGEVILDIDEPGGDTVFSMEYPKGTYSKKVLEDIRRYFETGEQPYISPLAEFRYSLKQDSHGRKLTEAQAEYFEGSKAVDAQGNLLVMYHGTRRGGFTVFREWAYLTADEKYARRYADPDTGETMYEVYTNVRKPFDTRLQECRELFRREYTGHYSNTPLQESGLPDWTDGYDLADFIEENGYDYDAILLDEGADPTDDGIRERGISWVVRSPEQIKSVTNETPTSDPDIRLSLKGSENFREVAALREENALLRERVEYWKGQTRRTKQATTDKKAVERAARELIRSHGADIAVEEIAGELQSLYDYIASGHDGADELTYTEARRRAEKISRALVSQAVAVDDDGYRQYGDLRSYLRNARLAISEEDSRNIADYGDFRRRNFGRMNLSKGGTNIDQAYKEMSMLWPEFFDENREMHPADQLVRIADVLDEIYSITEYNPFQANMEQAVAGTANEIMEMFFDLPQTRATFADRQARKLNDAKAKGRQRVQDVRAQRDARLLELREQNRERVREAIRKERVRREEQLDKLRGRYRAREQAGRERRSARELRAKIMRHAKALSRKLLRPSDKQHIPEVLRQATAAALEAINLESAYSVDRETGKRVKDGSGDPTKRTEAFRALRSAYAEIAKDGGDYTLVIDPDLMDNLNELEAMKNIPLGDMSVDQLSTVWATVKAVEASVRTANRMLGASKFETISQVADGIRNDNIMRKDRGDYKGFAGRLDKLVNLDMLTPQEYFHRMGQTGEELFSMLRSAQDRHISIMEDSKEATDKIVGRTDIKKLERETHAFDIDGQKLTMSTAQIMALYELMKRPQAQEHIFVGGIRPEAIQGGRGLREDRRADPVRVSVDDVAEITGVLTDEQVKMADALQRYMGGKLAELGNEASMAVYGYRKFNEKDYFPIQVDKNQTKKDIVKDAQAQTIAGRGFTKSTTPKANNAVMVGSIFDIYSAHVNDMATYAAWLSTMEDVRRIRDFIFRDDGGARVGDVKSIIERIFGRNGNAYLNKLVDDINQGVRSTGTGNLTDGIVGNYKAAAVAANIRVILQQPTAILRALNTLDPKYLLAGTMKRGDWAKVKKYAPIAVWKDWGYFDINTGRRMKDVLLNTDTPLQKVRQAAMAGAGKADSFAWSRLWNAVEAEVKDKRPGLTPGTDAFYRAVAERFGEIVDRTQVVDGLLQRSQIMRSPDGLTKMSTSFMAEPTKTYNMFLGAVYDLQHATGTEGRKRAKTALARTTAALAVSFAVNAVAQSLVDALRDDDKERDYWEKFVSAYTGFTGDEEGFLDYWNGFYSGNLGANFNPLAYLPYAKDLVSILRGYDVSRMDAEALEKLISAADNMRKALSGEGKYSLPGASANLFAEAARVLGIPVANLKRDVRAMVATGAIETDNYLLQYRMDKALLNMGYAGNTGGFMDILYNAMLNDEEAYEIIYADMVASGVPEDKISSAMEKRMKDDQGVSSVEELESRYLTPDRERAYSGYMGTIRRSPVWSAANQEQRDDLEADLYDLVTGSSAGEKLREKIDAGAEHGIGEADYLLYLAARDMASQDGNDNTSQAEAQEAIDMLPGLSDEARAYLWQATNKGWKEEKNPYR